jgi:NADPH-dependent 2,4-dienoyl-CoA reductase/sulfur reductase-like enzyme
MGGSELGFAFGFGPSLVDDRYLGVVSHRTPDVFVINDCYEIPVPVTPATEKAHQAYRVRLQNDYHLVLANELYRVYFSNKNSSFISRR